MNGNKVTPEEGKERSYTEQKVESDEQKNDVEVDTDEGDLVDDKFANSLGYYKAEYKVAVQFREDSLVRDEGNKYFSLCVSNFELIRFGIGVYLYFGYLKIFSIFLCILTVFSIPALVSNILGKFYVELNTSVIHYTTLGDQYGFKDQTTDSNWLTIDIDNKSYRTAVIVSDFLIILSLYIFMLIFKFMSKKRIYDCLSRTYSPSDYACYVVGFPDDAVTEQDIRDHFSTYGPIEEVVFSRRFAKLIKDYRAQDEANKALK